MSLVTAIIVCYQPDLNRLKSLLDSIVKQVEYVILIDNHSSLDIKRWLSETGFLSVQCTVLDENYGVAMAQNYGISWAKNQNSTHVVLFDQDSEPELDMVDRLRLGMDLKRAEGYRVAAVGAHYRDTQGQSASPFVKLKGFNLHRIECATDQIVEVDHLISSGCLISMDALDDIGYMEEGLFIDYVDTEWCLRAVHKGWSIFGVGSARMLHGLGDGSVMLFSRCIPTHSPLRYYYLIRNGIWLLRQPWVSKQWKIMDSKRLCLIFIAYAFFVKPRFANFKSMSLGLWHGLIGRSGKKP